MTGWEWQSIFSWEPLQLTSCWHRGLCYCQCAYFPKGPRAAWLSALSGLSAQDTNLSSIKIAVRFFFCLSCTVRLLGKGFLGIISIPGYSQPFLVIQYQNNTLYRCTLPRSSNPLLLMWLLLHLSILTSCLNRFPVHFPNIFFFKFHICVLQWGKTHTEPSHSQICWLNDRVKHKPVRRQAGVAPPQAIALWLFVTIVQLCSQALTSGDNGHSGKEERESACKRALAQIQTHTHK